MSAKGGLPRFALLGAGAAVCVTLLGVTAARLTGYNPRDNYGPAVAARALLFADQPDGAIVVTDASTGKPIGTVEPGSNGFLRATVRGLVNARKRSGEPQREVPFLLSLRADGTLTFQDPGTGRVLDLAAFGQTNADAFARFLPGTPSRSTGTL